MEAHSNSSGELIEVPARAGAEPNFPIRSRSRTPRRAPVPRQNRLVAGEEEWVGRMGLPVFSCGAASAHASICACKAFNTEERAGSIHEGSDEPRRTAEENARSDVPARCRPITMTVMPEAIPSAVRGQKYMSLTTFRKNGVAVATPVWFGEEADKLYVMTRSDMGKAKRIRNNPRVRVAPCTIRGKVSGPEFTASARILPREEHAHARQAINRKYWAARLPLIWYRTDTYLELTFP
ncbi:MAG: PPOX class F420-dependent oxidoreductase [Candidatus Sulfotelmatobacter sp.]